MRFLDESNEACLARGLVRRPARPAPAHQPACSRRQQAHAENGESQSPLASAATNCQSARAGLGRWVQAVLAGTGFAQTVYPVNAVGFYDISVPPGRQSLLANSLNAWTNTVGALFPNVPHGTQVMKLNQVPATVVTNIFAFGSWTDPQMTLVPGEGFQFVNPTSTNLTYTIVGYVQQGTLVTPIPSGTSWLGSQVPESGRLNTDLGLPVANGDTVKLVSGGVTNTFAFASGSWDPSEPLLATGQGFEFQTAIAKNWVRIFNASDLSPFDGIVINSQVTFTNVPPLTAFVTWEAASQTIYRVEVNTNLLAGAWQLLANFTNSATTNRVVTFSDVVPAGGTERYFRISYQP